MCGVWPRFELGVWFHCGDAALAVRQYQLTPPLRWCNSVVFASSYLLVLAFDVLYKCAYWS